MSNHHEKDKITANGYGTTALNEAESPVITWVQVLRSYSQYLGGVSYRETRGFPSEARAWLSVSACTKRIKALFRESYE